MIAPFNDRGPFKVGEVCVIVGSTTQPQFNGCEVVIVDVHGTLYGVDVKHPEGGMWLAREGSLRRKRPPPSGEQKIRAMFDVRRMAVPEVA